MIRVFGWLVLPAAARRRRMQRSWCSAMRSGCSAVRSPSPSRTGLTERSWRGFPDSPGGGVVSVARRRAIDQLRREGARAGKEREAVQERAAGEPDGSGVAGDDQLALLFACCHPALEPGSRVTLTLRVVCGLT